VVWLLKVWLEASLFFAEELSVHALLLLRRVILPSASARRAFVGRLAQLALRARSLAHSEARTSPL
jgi:hypothetical protein